MDGNFKRVGKETAVRKDKSGKSFRWVKDLETNQVMALYPKKGDSQAISRIEQMAAGDVFALDQVTVHPYVGDAVKLIASADSIVVV